VGTAAETTSAKMSAPSTACVTAPVLGERALRQQHKRRSQSCACDPSQQPMVYSRAHQLSHPGTTSLKLSASGNNANRLRASRSLTGRSEERAWRFYMIGRATAPLGCRWLVSLVVATLARRSKPCRVAWMLILPGGPPGARIASPVRVSTHNLPTPHNTVHSRRMAAQRPPPNGVANNPNGATPLANRITDIAVWVARSHGPPMKRFQL
jgi:hypothetical protein